MDEFNKINEEQAGNPAEVPTENQAVDRTYDTQSKQAIYISKPQASSRNHLSTVLKLLGVIGVTISIGLIYYNSINNPKTVLNKSPNQVVAITADSAQISVTKDGFVPATISVKKGTQITWTNTDTAFHQPASDPHPAHNLLPGFENTEVLQVNDSYSFIFEKAGTFSYHDELNPLTLKGTIIVE